MSEKHNSIEVGRTPCHCGRMSEAVIDQQPLCMDHYIKARYRPLDQKTAAAKLESLDQSIDRLAAVHK